MQAARHQSAVDSLRHISVVQPLSEADGPLVADLIAVLKKHNALDRFGITLLHKHFDMGAEECLLETTDIPTRISNHPPHQQG